MTSHSDVLFFPLWHPPIKDSMEFSIELTELQDYMETMEAISLHQHLRLSTNTSTTMTSFRYLVAAALSIASLANALKNLPRKYMLLSTIIR